MPEYWLDADSLIKAYREAYRFSYNSPFWDFLVIKANKGVIGSPKIIFEQEIASTKSIKEKDGLELWARNEGRILFIPPTDTVQVEYAKVADYIQNNGRYAPYHIANFLGAADPWLIAYSMALGGRIVTFEKSEPKSKSPKIPDVAKEFDIECLKLWDMLDELKFKFR